MKDKNGTHIRKGTYLIWQDTTNIFKAESTGNDEGCTCCWFVTARVVIGPTDPFNSHWNFSEEDMVDVLVLPRRLCVPTFKLDQIKLYAALAGLEIVKDGEDEH